MTYWQGLLWHGQQDEAVLTTASISVVIQYANVPGGNFRMIPGNAVPG